MDILAPPHLRRASAVFAIGRKSFPPRSNSSSTDVQPRGMLEGRRVLIVEDEFFVAALIEDTLQSFGCETVGPFTTLELGLQASRQENFDIAILDVNLNGKMVFPLADELLARGRPFVFLTGYASDNLPEAYRKLRRIQKPFNSSGIREVLEEALRNLN